MKNSILNIGSKLFFLMLCLTCGIQSFAQEGGTTSQTNTSQTNTNATTTSLPNDAAMWYSNPIVWVVGGIVLILIIVALVSRGNSKTEVIRTTTNSTEVR